MDFKEQIKNFLKTNQLTNSVDCFDKLMIDIKENESDDTIIFDQLMKNIKDQFLNPESELQYKLANQKLEDIKIEQPQEIQLINNWQMQKIKREQMEMQDRKIKEYPNYFRQLQFSKIGWTMKKVKWHGLELGYTRNLTE